MTKPPSDCDHFHTLFIARERDADHRRHASVCADCGTFLIWIDGQRMTFTLVSDEQLQAAGVYAARLMETPL